jgi:hypothetical protein
MRRNIFPCSLEVNSTCNNPAGFGVCMAATALDSNNLTKRHTMSITKSTLTLLLACALGLFGLAGCASLDAPNQKSLLVAAGFRARTPETPKQRELYAVAPPYKMMRATVRGKSLYAYKDEKEGVAYVGGAAEYQRYHQLALQQRIARENYMSAEMERDDGLNWYGAWGERRVWGF